MIQYYHADDIPFNIEFYYFHATEINKYYRKKFCIRELLQQDLNIYKSNYNTNYSSISFATTDIFVLK